MSPHESYDVVIIGAGHNGLAAAAYLAPHMRVLVLERSDHVGGAAVSMPVFEGVPAKLSRYSYLVSLLPQTIIDELNLNIRLASRTIGSYTPVQRDGRHSGLLVERIPSTATRDSFREVTGGDAEFDRWQRFYGAVEHVARVMAPTLLEPLVSQQVMRERVTAVAGDAIWHDLMDRPLGDTIEAYFTDDTVKGVVATDGLIGTFTSLSDPTLLANRCFLYHLIGNGTGEWKVPIGGMGAVTSALESAARFAGATIITSATASALSADHTGASIMWHDGREQHRTEARWALVNASPAALDALVGRVSPPEHRPEGSQVKINMLLRRLPRLRSGIDSSIAFRGTLHVDEGMAHLEDSYLQAQRGQFPTPPPTEVYCHTLTDSSILDSGLVAQGMHTMTLFGLHTPARLFAADPDGSRDSALAAVMAGLDVWFDDPLADCLATDAAGKPCIEIATPIDLEESLGLPAGHIFHRDLQWPYAEHEDEVGTWGVATDVATSVIMCGSGARRGGAVSAIPGRSAAMHVLEHTRR